MTLDRAQGAFRVRPNKRNAGNYMRALLKYECDDMIGDDTFLDGLSEVAAWLRKQGKKR